MKTSLTYFLFVCSSTLWFSSATAYSEPSEEWKETMYFTGKEHEMYSLPKAQADWQIVYQKRVQITGKVAQVDLLEGPDAPSSIFLTPDTVAELGSESETLVYQRSEDDDYLLQRPAERIRWTRDVKPTHILEESGSQIHVFEKEDQPRRQIFWVRMPERHLLAEANGNYVTLFERETSPASSFLLPPVLRGALAEYERNAQRQIQRGSMPVVP